LEQKDVTDNTCQKKKGEKKNENYRNTSN